MARNGSCPRISSILYLLLTFQREGSDDASESTALDEGTRIEGEGGEEEDADIVLPEYYSGEEEEEEEGGEM